MDFEIHDKNSVIKEKRKNDSKIIYALLILFFLLLSIVLLFIYFFIIPRNDKKVSNKDNKNTIEKVEKSQINIYDEKSNNRPIAFMIDNNIGDAKHAGLQESYLNYEIIVEGGLTRIMSLYKDRNVSLVGPIRSSRHYFLDYALENDAIYIHYGWSPQAKDDIKALSVDNVNGITDSTPFRRDENSVAPHNVFTNISYVNDYIEKKDYKKSSDTWKLLNISPKEIKLNNSDDNTNNAEKINISYSKNEYRTYTYDEINKYYLRSQNGKAHIDRVTDKQLNYKNIIILKVENRDIDEQGRQELKNIGNGEGYYITNGKYKKIYWTKETRLSKTKYKYEDGTDLEINDGNTFIQIVPINNRITIE